MHQDGAEPLAWQPLRCPLCPVSPWCRGQMQMQMQTMPVFAEKEMLGVDGAKKGFFPPCWEDPIKDWETQEQLDTSSRARLL